MSNPTLIRLPLKEYRERAVRDGVRTFATAYTIDVIDFDTGAVEHVVIAWDFASRLPWHGRRVLSHEWWHVETGQGNDAHAPWWAVRIECGHALRIRDPENILGMARPWLEANP